MIAPTLIKQDAFDATMQTYFNFQTDEIITSNRMVIRKYNEVTQGFDYIVYDKTITTSEQKHMLPATALLNGNVYSFQIQIFNSTGDKSSPLSQASPFMCIETPSINFTNFPTEPINASSYFFQLTYNQDTGEQLDRFKFTVYDNFNNIIAESPYLTNRSGEVPPYNFGTIIHDLENQKIFKIKCSIVTVNGIETETEMRSFSVDYESKVVFTNFFANYDKNKGYTELIGSPIGIPPTRLENDSYDFIENKYLDISNNTLTWDANYKVEGDFVLETKLKPSMYPRDFLLISNANDNSDTIELSYYYEGSNLVVKMLVYGNSGLESASTYYRTLLAFVIGDWIKVSIKREENYYDLSVVEQY